MGAVLTPTATLVSTVTQMTVLNAKPHVITDVVLQVFPLLVGNSAPTISDLPAAITTTVGHPIRSPGSLAIQLSLIR